MKKEINQSSGLNQVALINSKNNHIKIFNDPVAQVSSLMRSGKIKEAIDLLAEVQNEMGKSHPLYPNYTYEPMKFGSNLVLKHSPASREIAKEMPLRYKGRLSMKDTDFTHEETLDEFLTRKYFSQEKIKVDMKYLETWIGEQLVDNPFSFEQNFVENGDWVIVPEKLPSPIKSKLIFKEGDTERVILDYLELRVTEVSSKLNKIVISNKHQENSLIELSLTIPQDFSEDIIIHGNSKFNIKIRESFEGVVRAEKTLLEFLKYAEESSEMSLIGVESQKVFFNAEDMSLDNPNESDSLNDRIETLTELLQIENYFDVEFMLPEQIVEADFDKIEILKAVINNKEMISKVENLNVVFDNKEALTKLVMDTKKNPIVITTNEDIVVDIFDVKVKDIIVSYTIEDLKVKNPERIKNKLKYFDAGETVRVDFIPDTKNVVKTLYTVKK